MKNKNENCWLSIVIPCYNMGKYLPKCLDSIFIDNDYQNMEVICVNDGSTDNTAEILQQYKTKFPNNLCVLSQSNQGVSVARNVGIKNSNGKWVTTVDPDDYISKGVLAEIKSKIHDIREDIDLIYLGYRKMSRSGSISTVSMPETIYNSDEKAKIILLFDDLFWGTVWGKLFRLESIIKNNVFFDKSFKRAQDTLFICQYFPKIRCCMILHHIMYNYILNLENATLKYQPGDSEYKNLQKLKEAYQLCIAQLQTDPIILQKLQDRINDRFVHSTLFTIYTIYRGSNRPKEDYKAFLIGWDYLCKHNNLYGGGIFSSRVNKTFYHLANVHPYAGHLFLKFVFTVERLQKRLK